jgi:deazaflavin-dependent oxidoreductase (nitroreductase family)
MAKTSGGPQTVAAQRVVNQIVRGLLRTPLLSRVIGGRLVTLYVTGRKSGRRYTVPVAYTRHDGALLVGTGFAWGRNLRDGEPLEILLRGRKRLADVQVFKDEAEVTEAYAVICGDNPNFARLNKVGIGPNGEPDPNDLHAAWAAGARAFRLTPR